MPIDYSRWDHLDDGAEDSSSAAEEADAPGPGTPESAGPATPESAGAAPRGPTAPPDVLDDLEDYFQRLDQRLAEDEAQQDPDTAPGHVPRLAEDELDQLETGPWPLRSRYERLSRLLSRLPFARRLAPPEQSECAICLMEFQECVPCAALPCAARHVFHEGCARQWLSRSVQCPLCRVDVRPMLALRTPPASPARSRSPSPGPGSMTPRTLGYTRDGGRIERYDPAPPPEMPRPAYIPPEMHRVAQYVEISYEGQGTARVWRIPREDEPASPGGA